ncbi:MAG: diguanylate cyclase [Thermotogota bacterium]
MGVLKSFLNKKTQEKMNTHCLKTVVENNIDPVLLFEFHNDELYLIDYNLNACGFFPGIGKKRTLTLFDILQNTTMIEKNYQQIIFEASRERNIRFKCIKKNRTNYYLSFNGTAVFSEDHHYYLFLIRDMTQIRVKEDYLKETEKKYREMFDNSPIALWEQDFSEVNKFIQSLRVKSADHLHDLLMKKEELIVKCVSLIKITSLNKKTLELFEAQSPTELREFDLNATFFKIFTPNMYHTYIELLVSLYAGEKYFKNETDVFTLNRNKLQIMFRSIRLFDNETDWRKIEISIEDITEKNLLLKKLHEMAHEDSLTGLNNRRGFTFLGRQQLQIAKRERKKLTFLYVDMDGMKSINDAYGHKEGDEAIKALANILKKTFRDSDILARIGGDEFCGLLINTENETIESIKKRLNQSVHCANQDFNKPYKLSISIGLKELYPTDNDQLEDYLKATDQLMYEEKRGKYTERIS